MHAIVGTDSYLSDQALEALLQASVGPERGESVQVFRGDETGWPRVIEAARTGSLFAARRAVVVRGADALKGDGEEALSYLDDPSPGTVLVLLVSKPDRRRVVWKRILERAEVTTTDPPKGARLRGYVAEQLRRRRLSLSEGGLEELLERVGQDLQRLMGELDKLEAFARDATEPLSAEQVAAVLGKGLARPLYRIADAMSERRPHAVLELVEEALEDGEPPLKILAVLHRALRQVRGARALRQAGAAREQVVARLGVMPFKAGDILEASRAWSEPELQRALAALDRADRRVKSGLDGRLALAAAVGEACGRGGARPGT